mgnify:CR=1 FL=1
MRINLMGCAVDNLDMEETLGVVDGFIRSGRPHQHVVVNVDKSKFQNTLTPTFAESFTDDEFQPWQVFDGGHPGASIFTETFWAFDAPDAALLARLCGRPVVYECAAGPYTRNV